MSNREKILLCAVAASVVFGLYSLFWPAGAPDDTAERRNELESASQFAARTVAGLNNEQSRQAALTLAKANQPWRNSPFLRAERLPGREPENTGNASAPEEEDDPGDRLVYSGYLASPAKALAVINGREYLAGDQLEHSTYVLHEISADYVKIRKPDGTEYIIPWQEQSDQSENKQTAENKQTEPDR